MNETFTSNYTMEQLAADTHEIDHDKMNRRYLALSRLVRIKNGRGWRESFNVGSILGCDTFKP